MNKLVLMCQTVITTTFLLAAQTLWAENLTISAASSLTSALKEIKKNYEATYPATKLNLNFAASHILVQQLDQGAPVDVLITADTQSMQAALQKKLVRRPINLIANNQLILIVPALQRCPQSVQQLTGKKFERIAIGQPKLVPAGAYAQNAFNQLGLTPLLQPKSIYGGSVRQVLDYVRRGEVEAGVVYRSDIVAQAKEGAQNTVKSCHTLNTTLPIVYPAAMTSRTTLTTSITASAAHFLNYLAQPASQKVLQQYGFDPPSKSGTVLDPKFLTNTDK